MLRATVAAALLCVTATACVHVKVNHDVMDSTAAKPEIAAMMEQSARSWNRGDLDAFLQDYETDATYIGRTDVLRGREQIRTAYASRFAPGGVRDSLSFENLEVDVVGPAVLNAIAWYRLSRGDSTIARGPTSLVMRKAGGRWRIVHDHSS